MFLIASFNDSIYVNMNRELEKREVDIDEEFQISQIKCIIHNESSFYILANKARGKLGYFLIRMDEQSPIIRANDGE